MAVQLALSLMVEDTFRRAVLPLFEAGTIDALEYSFEIGWTPAGLPGWAEALLDHYADAGRLWGHGVTLSPWSGDAGAHHRRTLERIDRECRRRSYRGVSEHYGFMRESGLDGGAPLPPPPGAASIERGIAALRRLAATTGGAVGLENLALALSPRDVWAQGPTLSAVLDAVDGYLVLDLHNLDCQVHNFGVDRWALLDTYPLSRVRCIHVSGGSWSQPSVDGTARRFRRDTHDDVIPPAVLDWLPQVLRRCPALEAVVVERLGPTVRTADDARAFVADIEAVRDGLAGHSPTDGAP